jgi:predicted DNA-binding transcriptional regulator AlpA
MNPKAKTNFDDLSDVALIRLKHLIRIGVLPYSATTIWRKCRSNEFPKPIKVSKGITAWRVGDIRKHLADISRVQTYESSKNKSSSKGELNG